MRRREVPRPRARPGALVRIQPEGVPAAGGAGQPSLQGTESYLELEEPNFRCSKAYCNFCREK
jgi:hypothetical protein